MFRIIVRALWFDPKTKYVGALLKDRTPVTLCSWEKWESGYDDSLRRNWVENIKVFSQLKAIYTDVPEWILREDGLKIGQGQKINVPERLIRK